MAHTETFDPKRYTPFERGHEAGAGPQHVSRDRHRRRWHEVLEGPGADWPPVHGSRDAHPQLHGRRSRVHSALAPPVSLAHGLRAAADGRRAAHRRDHRAHARPAEPRRPRLHQHRPALRRRRRRGAEGLHHGRLSRQRVRPVQHSIPRSGRRQRPPARRDDARAGSRIATSFYRRLLEASPIGEHGSAYQKESLLRSMDNAHRLLSSPAAKAFDLSLEPLERVRQYVPGYQPGQQFRRNAGPLRRQVRTADGRPLRARLPARAAAGRSRRALHRGHDGIHSVPQLGHARERAHAYGGNEAADRRADRAARAATSKNAGCSTAR